MRLLVIFIFAAFIPKMAFADGHTTPGAGYGTAVTVSSKKIEGTSGVLVYQTKNDVWIWENPLKGFSKATSATCDQFFLLHQVSNNQSVALSPVSQLTETEMV